MSSGRRKLVSTDSLNLAYVSFVLMVAFEVSSEKIGLYMQRMSFHNWTFQALSKLVVFIKA